MKTFSQLYFEGFVFMKENIYYLYLLAVLIYEKEGIKCLFFYKGNVRRMDG
jgi:hypothetical protein